MFWGKYGTQTTFTFPVIKRAAVDLAQTGDWTPASTDAAISKDGGNAADTTNTVAFVGGSPTRGTSMCKLTLTATEMQAAEISVQIVDAATKAIEDQFLTIYTYGNASAKVVQDWSVALPANSSLLSIDGSGRVDVIKVAGTTQTARDIGASVLLSNGTGTGQLKLASGYVAMTWADIAAPTTTVSLSGTTVGTVTAVGTVTTLTNLPAITANWLTAAGTAADFDTEIAAAVWDLATSGHTTSGTFGAAMAAAGAAGDPWSTSLPGSYGAGTAGKIVGDNVNASISAVKAKTDNLPAAPASTTNITAGTITTVSAVTGLTASNLDATISSRLASSSYVSPTTALTESYSALHAAPTLAQLLFEIRSLLAEKAVASTTLTAKKIDGSTTAMVLTLNDATTPTSITRTA